MNKGSLLSDTFEQLAELGKSTAQKAGQAVKSLTIDTVDKAQREMAGQNFTSLDKAKLETDYKKQDMEKAEEVRRELRRYLDLQKSEEKKAVEARNQEEEKRKEKLEEEEKLKKQKEQEAQKQITALPKGKERKSIFSAKKVAKRSQMETRAGSGKQ